ncbi:hypothetical protein ACP70R_031392 [Stipagrostis hirtigluma subsp. patula]
MDAQLHRLVPLLFLLACPFFLRDGGSTTVHDRAAAVAADLHPVVLLPGHTCSQLDARLTDEYQTSAAPGCGARKQGNGWFRLWENHTALQEDPALVPCYANQLRLVYDPVAGDYRNVPGVETRVVGFGTTNNFGSDDPTQRNNCMRRLVEALEAAGYREGENLFGAPYDFRYAPAPRGQAASEFSHFVSTLRALVERASEGNGNKPAILVTHSHGGLNAIDFLNGVSLPWRRRYIKHFVMVSTGAGGIVASLRSLVSGTGSPSSPADVLSFGSTSRSFASVFSALPSPRVFGRAPLVVTRARNYSAHDMPELLAAAGFSDGEVALYRARALPVALGFRAPAVPMTCINGAGVPTVERLVYWDGDFGAEPEVVYGDGDGAVNMASILALDTVIGDDPDQGYYKSVLIPNATHGGIMSDDFALEIVVSEILEANRATL